MRRKSLISQTTIRRLVSASNKIQKYNNNKKIIESQGGNEKEKAPSYSLKFVDFNSTTRVTKIEFLQTQEYRTIQRYITQNYTKYPIYSEWKIKEKVIKKTIKLTNLELENLNHHEDDLIKMFADEIISSIDNTELYPSWFITLYLNKEMEEKLQELDNELRAFNRERRKNIENCRTKIENTNSELNFIKESLQDNLKQLKKEQSKLEKIALAKPNILKFIFSLGIYAYMISEKRKEKIRLEIKYIEDDIKDINSRISFNNTALIELADIININEKEIANEKENYEKKKEKIIIESKDKISLIKPLIQEVKTDDSFIKLKNFIGLEYEKITGCYIIHNKENDKYYIGQSKDVYKRLKQHFKGTIPNNSIFAEDYYTSTFKDKSELFEVKIIKCETKDELDSIEKKLIAEYDSWNNGYNRTSGNI